jgi:hypothetical protein
MTESTRTPDREPPAPPAATKRGVGCLGVTAIVIATMLVTLLAGGLAVRYLLFANHFEPVTLDAGEAAALDRKLAAIGVVASEAPSAPPTTGDRFAPRADEFDAEGRLRPERYGEAGAPREVHFGERELNAIIAGDPQLARRMALDLSQDLVSLKLLVPLPPDFPVMGGQTVRVTAGAEVRQTIGPTGEPRLSVVVTGVSLWGIPLPDAWIGGLRGVDLVEEFGRDPGFWQALAAGVDQVQVEEGELRLRLAE